GFSLTLLPPPAPPLFPYTTLFRSPGHAREHDLAEPSFVRTPSALREERELRTTSYGLRAISSPACRRWRPVCRRSSLRPRHLPRSEEHPSELQSRVNLVCRLLLEK